MASMDVPADPTAVPVIVDPRVLVGEALILQIYCPKELQEFKDTTQDLKTDDVLEN